MQITLTGWFQIYELEREKREDELIKTRLILELEEQQKQQKLDFLLKKGECDD